MDVTCLYDDGQILGTDPEMFWGKPDGYDSGNDYLNWAIVMAEGAEGYALQFNIFGTITSTAVSPGLNYGSLEGLATGAQSIKLINSQGVIVMTAVGDLCIDSGCPDEIYNMNYQVAAFEMGDIATGTCSDPGSPGGGFTKSLV
jgi:hypothetical protein